jgi:hypothetical protein
LGKLSEAPNRIVFNGTDDDIVRFLQIKALVIENRSQIICEHSISYQLYYISISRMLFEKATYLKHIGILLLAKRFRKYFVEIMVAIRHDNNIPGDLGIRH